MLPIESKFVSLNSKYQDFVAKLKTEKKIASHSCNLSSDGAMKLTFLPFNCEFCAIHLIIIHILLL